MTNPATTIKFWVEEYSDKLYSWALHKTASKETAEDLVQETFIAAFQSFSKFESRSQPLTWLFSILKNKITDYYRSSFRKPVISHALFNETIFDAQENWNIDERPQAWTGDSIQLLDNNEFIEIFEACLKRLPETWFAVIQLKYLEEKKAELICQELDLTKTNYWQMFHRAKLQLRKCLENNWFKI